MGYWSRATQPERRLGAAITRSPAQILAKNANASGRGKPPIPNELRELTEKQLRKREVGKRSVRSILVRPCESPSLLIRPPSPVFTHLAGLISFLLQSRRVPLTGYSPGFSFIFPTPFPTEARAQLVLSAWSQSDSCIRIYNESFLKILKQFFPTMADEDSICEE